MLHSFPSFHRLRTMHRCVGCLAPSTTSFIVADGSIPSCDARMAGKRDCHCYYCCCVYHNTNPSLETLFGLPPSTTWLLFMLLMMIHAMILVWSHCSYTYMGSFAWSVIFCFFISIQQPNQTTEPNKKEQQLTAPSKVNNNNNNNKSPPSKRENQSTHPPKNKTRDKQSQPSIGVGVLMDGSVLSDVHNWMDSKQDQPLH